MYTDPVLWHGAQQLLGEEVKVYMNDSTIDWAHIINQALAVEQKDSIHYNQVTGKEMKAFFQNGDMRRVDVNGNVLIVFYPEEKDSTMIGMNYVEIPFLAHLAFGKDRGLQFFIHAGPQIGFLLGDSEKIDGDWDGTVAESYTNITVEQHGKAIDNKFDYGIAGGAGIELRTKAGNFIVEGRYYYALSDFYGSTKKDFFSRSAHGVITAKITYLFDLKK